MDAYWEVLDYVLDGSKKKKDSQTSMWMHTWRCWIRFRLVQKNSRKTNKKKRQTITWTHTGRCWITC